MARASIAEIISVSLLLVILGIVAPIGLVYIANAEWAQVTLANGTQVYLRDVVDPTIITLFTVLLPIMAVIGFVMWFIPRVKR